jgi:hypothetical protein
MELGIKLNGIYNSLPKIFGFLSFLIALIALAGLNVSLLLLKQQGFPSVFLIQLPMVSFFLGIIGLFTQKRSRLFAIWGLSLSVFLFIFTFLMVVLSLGINYKP